MHEFVHILIHTLEHGLHILPFLYLAFLIIDVNQENRHLYCCLKNPSRPMSQWKKL